MHESQHFNFLNSQLLNAPRIFQTEEYNAKDPQAKPNRFAHEASAKVVKNFVKDVHCNLTWIFLFREFVWGFCSRKWFPLKQENRVRPYSSLFTGYEPSLSHNKALLYIEHRA